MASKPGLRPTVKEIDAGKPVIPTGLLAYSKGWLAKGQQWSIVLGSNRWPPTTRRPSTTGHDSAANLFSAHVQRIPLAVQLAALLGVSLAPLPRFKLLLTR
jgi:hypothetical protein